MPDIRCASRLASIVFWVSNAYVKVSPTGSQGIIHGAEALSVAWREARMVA